MAAFPAEFDFSMDEPHQYPPEGATFYRVLTRFHGFILTAKQQKLLTLLWLWLFFFCF